MNRSTLAILTGCSLLVGLAALHSLASPVAGGTPAARLFLRLPDPVIGIAVIAGSLAWLLFAIVALSRRRAAAGEEGPGRERPRLPPWARAVSATLSLLLYLLAAYALWRPGSPLPDLLARLAAELGRLGGFEPSLPGASGPPLASSPLVTAVAAAMLLAVTLGTLGLMAMVLFGERVARWWAGTQPARRERRPGGAVEERLDDLGLEADPRAFVIRCYRRFEEALAGARVPRAPWQTPTEFMREALARLPLPRGAVHQLTGLFERSRFSDEALGPVERETAWASLVAITASLPPRDSDAPSA